MHIEEIINRFQNVKKIGEKQFQCSCPAHPDSKPSLTISEENNKILIYDHARMRHKKYFSFSWTNRKRFI